MVLLSQISCTVPSFSSRYQPHIKWRLQWSNLSSVWRLKLLKTGCYRNSGSVKANPKVDCWWLHTWQRAPTNTAKLVILVWTLQHQSQACFVSIAISEGILSRHARPSTPIWRTDRHLQPQRPAWPSTRPPLWQENLISVATVIWIQVTGFWTQEPWSTLHYTNML